MRGSTPLLELDRVFVGVVRIDDFVRHATEFRGYSPKAKSEPEGPALSGPWRAGDCERERQSDADDTEACAPSARRPSRQSDADPAAAEEVVPPGMLPLSREGPAPSGPRRAGDCGTGGQSDADDTEVVPP